VADAPVGPDDLGGVVEGAAALDDAALGELVDAGR